MFIKINLVQLRRFSFPQYFVESSQNSSSFCKRLINGGIPEQSLTPERKVCLRVVSD